MGLFRRWGVYALAVACILSATGCTQVLYNLTPKRLRRLNHHPPMSQDAYFSVPAESEADRR